MSKSPSAPTNNSKPASSSSEILSTSRTQTHEATATAIEHNSPASSSPTFIHPSTSEASAAGPSRIHPRESDAESEPMAKRFRAEPVGGRQSDRSSPSSDSQGGMADTEEGPRSERSPAPSEPPKKKRTRTLTTPHQSTVLHALLAQVSPSIHTYHKRFC